jgi:hypothetical protein
MRRQAKRRRDKDKPEGKVKQDDKNDGDSPDKNSPKEKSSKEEEDEEEQVMEVPVARIASVEVVRPRPNYILRDYKDKMGQRVDLKTMSSDQRIVGVIP